MGKGVNTNAVMVTLLIHTRDGWSAVPSSLSLSSSIVLPLHLASSSHSILLGQHRRTAGEPAHTHPLVSSLVSCPALPSPAFPFVRYASTCLRLLAPPHAFPTAAHGSSRKCNCRTPSIPPVSARPVPIGPMHMSTADTAPMCRPTIPHALCLDACNTCTEQCMHIQSNIKTHTEQHTYTARVDTLLVRNGAAKRGTKTRGRKVVSLFHRASHMACVVCELHYEYISSLCTALP